MVMSVEYLAIIAAILVFVFQSLYKFGKLSGKVDALDENVCFIRDYLLCRGAEIKHFKQNSPIMFENENGENLLNLKWKEKLKLLESKSVLSDDPLDTAVYLTNMIGLIEFFDEAKKNNIDVNTLIISSAIYYNKVHQAG
jgi:hypothetical protein